MIKSMTGYGRSEGVVGNKKFTIEVRSLNSKQLDLNLRMPSIYKEKEMDLRKFLSKQLTRGKIDVSIFYESQGTEKKVSINKSLMESYFEDFKEVGEKFGQENIDYLSLMIRIPEILKTEREDLDEEEWKAVFDMIQSAVERLNKYRAEEGEDVQTEFSQRINKILELRDSLEGPLKSRMDGVKSRINNNLNEFIDRSKIDQNRFEQELIYYLERLDVSEEQQRLLSNCEHFIEVLNSKESSGKKLGFVCQEIGREVNTLGSKANNSDIQQIVVEMKNELEKIKEQVLNIL